MARLVPSKEMRRRYKACLELVYDGVDPWVALELLVFGSPAIEKAERGELPDAWRMLSEEELDGKRREAYRTRYHGRKAA